MRPLLLIALLCTAFTLAACSGQGTSSVPSVQTTTTVATDSTVATASKQSASVIRLAAYPVDPAKVFLAGISSGGFFAVQMHVAHSATFKGAAVYAGGVYYCAQDSVSIALAACGGEGLYASTLTPSEAYLDLQSSLGTIDPKDDLSGQPVYLWSGTGDTVVDPREMHDLNAEYGHYGARIVFDSSFPAEHGWESPAGELSCSTLGSPYMINCNQGAQVYDSENTWLKLLLGSLEPRNNGKLVGSLLNFDQTEFGANAGNSMDTNGYVFVPKSCATGHLCGLIVAFHGCLQTQADIGTRFITESGIDEWADRNDIVVLYPYAVKSSVNPLNPNGCWDWWGYDGPDYALKSGTQVSIVYKMVQRIMGTR